MTRAADLHARSIPGGKELTTSLWLQTALLLASLASVTSPYVMLVVPSWSNPPITQTLASSITRLKSSPSR